MKSSGSTFIFLIGLSTDQIQCSLKVCSALSGLWKMGAGPLLSTPPQAT